MGACGSGQHLTEEEGLMESPTVARFGGQWHGWSDLLGEWLPLPLTPEADDDCVRAFCTAHGTTVRIMERHNSR